ncbi:hypothetical protein CDD80_4755 [Ophiocordyceps camponoti-rufipedis]|uniref:Helicase C-terminal domain-containing protein n=1 Tax=Ophiocordyceps camponoti-rufipedis TaxID=2004952 RepID=A0A2C5YYX5_9HYPO|nr:hypothetical protein CDD80_4755 [Ophiocordyceps camponoti-rufipedis]
MLVPKDGYIPAGCVSFTQAELAYDDEAWMNLRSVIQDEWIDFDRISDEDLEAEDVGSQLPEGLQGAVFKIKGYKSLSLLFEAGWIHLQIRLDSASSTANIRVHLLPDDAYNAYIDRSSQTLKAKRANLLRCLDFSNDAWEGRVLASTSSDEDDGVCESLLQIFNRIQSPNPEPSLVEEACIEDAMCDLLNSAVPGLKTELYSYQRRSAALMLQRESQPGMYSDPRLVTRQDQAGKPYHVDTIAGAVRVEQRFYDGVCGGILAEEMGSGKTLICLAVILATKGFPTKPPDIYAREETPTRKTIAPLTVMAASCAVRNFVAWKPYFDNWKAMTGLEHERCIDLLKGSRASYYRPDLTANMFRDRRRTWMLDTSSQQFMAMDTIFLSSATVVIVPNNLVKQWKSEIEKHTTGLNLAVLIQDCELPSVSQLLAYDMILFSQSRFEQIAKEKECSLSTVHFKRCIVDEGHKLGNSQLRKQSQLLSAIRSITFSAHWIVTGTPAHGLYGVDSGQVSTEETSAEMERKDIQRLGSMASLYLGARPWANRMFEGGDECASWDGYMLPRKHEPLGHWRTNCLKSTLNSLVVRHRLAEVSQLLPAVEEKIVMLDGCYQDKLSLNAFAMMIIFNSVQSERKDRDYFFHWRQKSSLLQIVHNLKQTTFFGGSFFSSEEMRTAIETAEEFLAEGKVAVSAEDERLLREAIEFGHVAVRSKLRDISHGSHEIPVCVEQFPANAGGSWSLDGQGGDEIITSASLLSAVQKTIHTALEGPPEKLNSLLNGGLARKDKGDKGKRMAEEQPDGEREAKSLKTKSPRTPSPKTKSSKTKSPKKKSPKTTSPKKLAGNTTLGDSSPKKKTRSQAVKAKEIIDLEGLPAPLQATRVVATASAKLSYLVDSILRHQEKEKILVFYENETTAWYVASMLDVLQIQHLIYAKGLSTERRGQYVDTFHQNPAFRVMLMDISQAAFGLDMREASRIYFISPVLNPQVEAQAIGRLRRISQQKAVTVETLVLRNSIDEVILERKKHMTQAEHRQVKSILDIQPIYNWIKNVQVVPLGEVEDEVTEQMAAMESRPAVFGREGERPARRVGLEAGSG